MKKLVFSFLLIFNSIMVFSQLAPWETTLEEYNYITKGYAVQLEQGLDMKAGYEFNDYLMGFGTPYIINTGDGGKISIELKLLINKTKEHPNRALMVIYKYENEEGLKFDSPGFYYRYLCIPNNAEIYGLSQLTHLKSLSISTLSVSAVSRSVKEMISKLKTHIPDLTHNLFS